MAGNNFYSNSGHAGVVEGSELCNSTVPEKFDTKPSEDPSGNEETTISPEFDNNGTEVKTEALETEEERQRREEEESIELARMLMAEEAMASYHHSVQMLRESRDQLSSEDYEALQNALREEEQADEDQVYEDNDEDLSYEAMLRLGERIGDVKADRWTMVAQRAIDELPTEVYKPENVRQDADDSEFKCLVCQHEYCCDEELRRLPTCGHCFHMECVDQWLLRTDLCPYCRTSIQKNES